jgi:hypothetical protein
LAEKAIERNQPGVLGTPADVFSKNGRLITRSQD